MQSSTLTRRCNECGAHASGTSCRECGAQAHNSSKLAETLSQAFNTQAQQVNNTVVNCSVRRYDPEPDVVYVDRSVHVLGAFGWGLKFITYGCAIIIGGIVASFTLLVIFTLIRLAINS